MSTAGPKPVITRAVKSLAIVVLGALALASAACGAARDPDLELRVIKARAAAAASANAPPPSAPPPATAASTRASGVDASKPAPVGTNMPLKSYTADEIAAILAAVPGNGTSLVADIVLAPAPAPAPQGTVSCTLDAERAPQAVANFVGLAMGQLGWSGRDGVEMKQPLYDGLGFHRIQSNYIIQAGNPTGKVNAGPGWRLAREPGLPEAFDAAGALAMLEDGDAIHGSQFFITVRPSKGLVRQYMAFGRCTSAELVRDISNAETLPETSGKTASVPKNPTLIASIRIRRAD